MKCAIALVHGLLMLVLICSQAFGQDTLTQGTFRGGKTVKSQPTGSDDSTNTADASGQDDTPSYQERRGSDSQEKTYDGQSRNDGQDRERAQESSSNKKLNVAFSEPWLFQATMFSGGHDSSAQGFAASAMFNFLTLDQKSNDKGLDLWRIYGRVDDVAGKMVKPVFNFASVTPGLGISFLKQEKSGAKEKFILDFNFDIGIGFPYGRDQSSKATQVVLNFSTLMLFPEVIGPDGWQMCPIVRYQMQYRAREQALDTELNPEVMLDKGDYGFVYVGADFQLKFMHQPSGVQFSTGPSVFLMLTFSKDFKMGISGGLSYTWTEMDGPGKSKGLDGNIGIILFF